ncbi:hypothetical protein [Rhodococcus sp. 14-2470-1a]|uniref:hypothetical protein n=1 Tax=Rhodococcus sp. 14-2470-1a TaxID=2023150 RepID=UPI000B9BDA46|nr:hypothetical protein [Rhodococcus sp. 14-2470-1a]OZF47579.1 hypothetical protein CH292_19350 [Rhodococcus sp. 14-2470-1a]
MQPLVVRRAGAFEKVTFVLSGWIGALAVVTPFEISTALDRAWPTGSNLYFAIMGLGGLGGFIAVRASRRQRTAEQIRHECRAEVTALVIIGVLWFGYGIAAFALGVQAIVAGSIGTSVLVASSWRVIEIILDLRRMSRALVSPKPADPPALGESEAER